MIDGAKACVDGVPLHGVCTIGQFQTGPAWSMHHTCMEYAPLDSFKLAAFVLPLPCFLAHILDELCLNASTERQARTMHMFSNHLCLNASTKRHM